MNRRKRWRPQTSHTQSLRELQSRAEAMAKGDFSALGQPVNGSREIEALRRAMDVMGAHIEQAQVGMQDYIAALTNAQEAERERVARELHDDTVQRLIALGQGVERVQRALQRDTTLAAERLQALRSDIMATVQSLRTIISGLRPPVLDDLGLTAAIETLLQHSDSAPKVTINIEGDERRLDPRSELALFRIIQEAWSNILRHAAAHRVKITLRYREDALEVEIVDDGRGFVTPVPSIRGHHRFGLIGMQERATLAGGSLQINSRPGQGTHLHVRMPYPGVASRDPICNMLVGPDGLSTEYNGITYRFCSHACRDLFLTEPERYINETTTP
jgi:signal transduction histidine kinase/YHS domain-containing protein